MTNEVSALQGHPVAASLARQRKLELVPQAPFGPHLVWVQLQLEPNHPAHVVAHQLPDHRSSTQIPWS